MTHVVPVAIPFIPTSIDYAKAKAKLLRKLLAVDCPPVSLALAQQLTAKALGHADWHALDQSVKQKLTPSPLSQELVLAEQSLRWRGQRDVLLSVPNIQSAYIPEIIEEWALMGSFKVQVLSSEADVRRAVGQAWPQDESVIRREVHASLRLVVQLLVEDARTSELGPLKNVTFASVLGRILTPRPSPFGNVTPPKSVNETLQAELFSGNDGISEVCHTAIRLLGGSGYGGTREFEVRGKVESELAKRLYPLVLSLAGQQSLWDLLFVSAGPDGLTHFMNTRQGLRIPPRDREEDGDDDIEDDDEDGGARELDDNDAALPPLSPEIVTIPVAPGLVVEVLHLPDFNEYEDVFRLTRIRANLRTDAGDNIGFLNGRLYESAGPDISRHGFLMVADSLTQDAMEMAEAVVTAYPRITKCFDYGSFLHIESLELATVARGGENSALLLEATLEHCNDISEYVAALCLDVRPVQFPWFSRVPLPPEIVQECERVNKKLRRRLRVVLARPPFRELQTRVVRYCYPDAAVQKV